MGRFDGKVCWVSGGGSGIGRAACVRLAAEGARVAVVTRTPEHADETVRLIADAGGEARAFACDVADGAAVRAAIDGAAAAWGRLDVVVSDAAEMTFTPLVDLGEDEWDHLMRVNLRSAFLAAKYAVPHLPRGGVLVNVSSVHAHATTPGVVPYATSKGGIEAFTRGLALELQPRGIRVVAVAPGAVDTPMLRENPNVRSGAEEVDGPVASPEALAAVLAFVASDEASFVNGTTVVADGARLARL